ncbi:MAG TPA: hypothetical protein VKZ53_25980 [Candidatus Angelobacter sp.]|nr:hypothetical protein [Candidatus Angelobacter sp.]
MSKTFRDNPLCDDIRPCGAADLKECILDATDDRPIIQSFVKHVDEFLQATLKISQPRLQLPAALELRLRFPQPPAV